MQKIFTTEHDNFELNYFKDENDLKNRYWSVTLTKHGSQQEAQQTRKIDINFIMIDVEFADNNMIITTFKS